MPEVDESGNAWDKAIRDEAQALMMDRIRFGFCAVGPDGKRIDPRKLNPRESSVKAPECSLPDDP